MISIINDTLWGGAVIFLIFAAWIYLSVMSGFPQLHLIKLFRGAFGAGESHRNGISRSQAISTALAASMGTGNIAGAAAAIAAGGAGSVMWMLIAAFFGMSAAYAENWLGAIHSTKHGIPPPVSYIKEMPLGKYTSAVYSAACIGASFFMGNMIQGNALCNSVSSLTGGNIYIISLICAALLGIIIMGGRRRIAAAAEKVIPAASVIYILSAAAVIFVFRRNIASAVCEIIASAFGIKAAAGGIAGYSVKCAVSAGMRRGIFSNEAGLGSSVLVHSASSCDDPHTVGCWAACEVFIDTVICCTLTSLALLVSGADCTSGELSAVEYAFEAALGIAGRYIVPVSMILFAGASVLGWCCCGEICLKSLAGKNKKAVTIYRALHTAMLFIGGISGMKALWCAADTVNWIMLAINLPAAAVLFPQEFARQQKQER